MDWKLIQIIGGIAIAAAVMLDVFATVVVPGRVNGTLKIPFFLRLTVFPVWRRMAALVQRRWPPVIGSKFAAAILLGVFLVWLLLLLIGMSLIDYGLRDDFNPVLPDFAASLFQTGQAMVTLGLGKEAADGWARAVIVLAGIGGLLVITLTLTFIVQVQTALRDRDALVIKLVARAGLPPSGLSLLLTLKELDLTHELPAMFDKWEDWVSALLHTHAAHPVLSYFRSDESGSDWITALGAVLDAASLSLGMIEDVPHGNAKLMHRIGCSAIGQLSKQFRLPDASGLLEREKLDEAWEALRDGGYRMEQQDEGVAATARLRRGYAEGVRALAHHFGVSEPAWRPEPQD